MNKTEACQLAKQTLRSGWFHQSATSAYIFCPKCRNRLYVTVPAWAKPADRRKAVRQELVDHLTFEGDCDGV